jgi:hypothetical protein
MRIAPLLAAAALALLAASGARAQGNDDLYDVTVRMEMPGMPMTMPAVNQRVCVRKGGSDTDIVPRQENCRVTDGRRAGNRLTFTMVCTGREPMTGAGEFTLAADGYDGRIRFTSRVDGQDMEMMQSIAGKRVGACAAR